MAVWSVAQSGDISIAGRIDSDFFHPEFLVLDEILHQLPTERIDRQFSISDGNHISISRHFTPQGEVPYFRGQDINSFFLENSQPIRIPQKVFDFPGMKRSHFFGEDVLICIVGASTGTIGLVSEPDTPATGSCKIGIIRKKNGAVIDPLYLAPFLMGKFGQYQVRRHSRGTAQGGLILIDLMKLSVPVLPWEQQQAIRALVSSSVTCNSVSRQLYTQAQQLLESELGLDKLRFDKPVGYTARFSVVGLADSVNANRIDAQCFSPEAVFYEDWLLKHANCDRLSLLLASTAKGRQQAEAETGTTDYCSIKHITGREIVGASKAYPSAGTPSTRKDDLLLAITGATIGKIGIVNRYDNLVFSGDILRLRANGSVSPHYLLLTLDHHLGQVQFNRWITGSTNGHLAPRDVGRVLVPRLAPATEEQIAALVAESLEKRQVSEQLLNQAKSRVEQLIEEAVRA